MPRQHLSRRNSGAERCAPTLVVGRGGREALSQSLNQVASEVRRCFTIVLWQHEDEPTFPILKNTGRVAAERRRTNRFCELSQGRHAAVMIDNRRVQHEQTERVMLLPAVGEHTSQNVA